MSVYKKTAGTTSNYIFIGHLSPNEWEELIRRKSLYYEPDIVERYTSVPTFENTRMKEVNTRVTWKENLPPLFQKDFWWYSKWVEYFDQTHYVYHARVNSLALIRNSFTGLVRVEFSYDTALFNIATGLWDDC